MPIAAIEKKCSQRSEIATYLDGELLPREELDLEAHLINCADCRKELNEQKKFLCALDFVLEDEGAIRLPENFTEIVVANAESKVSGLRRPQERSTAFFFCTALFLLVIVGLGSETEASFKTFADFAEQCLVVVNFVFHFFYDIALGTAIVLRSISSQVFFGSTFSLALTIILFGLSLFALLRLVKSSAFKIQTQEK